MDVNIIRKWHYVIFTRVAFRFDSSHEEPYLRAVAQIAQTRIAIALERFHFAHGVFPETLGELAPDFLAELPLDPWSGQPMRYRRNKSDTYGLYSVGEDRRDDGGNYDPARASTGQRQRDAIWLYSPP